MEARRGGTDRPAHARHPGLGHRESQLALDEQRDRARGDRVGGVVVTVAGGTDDAREARVRRDAPAVVGERAHLDRRVAANVEHVDVG